MRSYRIDEDKPINPGLFRHRITWQRKATSSDQSMAAQNSFGEDLYDWADVLACAAQVKATDGSELAGDGQRWAKTVYEITQHFSRGLLTGDRIKWVDSGTTRYLDVLQINDRAGTGRIQNVIAEEHTGDPGAA